MNKSDDIVRTPNTTTNAELAKAIKKGEEGYYVPIQKFTAMFAFGIIKMYKCEDCESRGDGCKRCTVTTLLNRLEESVRAFPFMDQDMNLIVPKED